MFLEGKGMAGFHEKVFAVLASFLPFGLQGGCGGTTGVTNPTSSMGLSVAGVTGGAVGVGVGKSVDGVTIGGNVQAPTSIDTAVGIDPDASKSLATVSKAIITEAPAKSGDVTCKRYDGTLVTKGVVSALGEIADVVVPLALLDETKQILCEVTLSDGRKLLNNYDLTNRKAGEKVISDCDVAALLAAQQILFQCNASTTFDDLSACGPKVFSKDIQPGKLFEEYKQRGKDPTSEENNLVRALRAGMASNVPPRPSDINRILGGNGASLLDQYKKFDDSLSDWDSATAIKKIEGVKPNAIPATKFRLTEEEEYQLLGPRNYTSEELEAVVSKIKEEEKVWSQDNMGKVEMLDPYGHSKDDRMELYGNRGRVISKPKKDNPYFYTHYIYVDGYTHWLCLNGGSSSVYSGSANLGTLGYTAEEAAFLLNLTSTNYNSLMAALLQSFVAMPPVETPLAPIAELDLKRLLNYVDSNEYNNDLATLSWSEFVALHPYYDPYGPGDTVAYAVGLTNPYDTPLNLSVKAMVTYMNIRWSIAGRGLWNTLAFEYLNGYPLPGESTQVWENVTLNPGETLTLSDTYNMPVGTLRTGSWLQGWPFTGLYVWGSILNGYAYDVTITDLNTGKTYNDPAAGFFGYSGNWGPLGLVVTR